MRGVDLLMATSDHETLVDRSGEILEADVSCGPSSQRMDVGSVILGCRVDGNTAAEPVTPNLVRTENHSDKLSTTTLSTLFFSDSLLKWSSISIGAYVGAFSRIGLTYFKIWYVIKKQSYVSNLCFCISRNAVKSSFHLQEFKIRLYQCFCPDIRMHHHGVRYKPQRMVPHQVHAIQKGCIPRADLWALRKHHNLRDMERPVQPSLLP
jgi:hypothetical protein